MGAGSTFGRVARQVAMARLPVGLPGLISPHRHHRRQRRSRCGPFVSAAPVVAVGVAVPAAASTDPTEHVADEFDPGYSASDSQPSARMGSTGSHPARRRCAGHHRGPHRRSAADQGGTRAARCASPPGCQPASGSSPSAGPLAGPGPVATPVAGGPGTCCMNPPARCVWRRRVPRPCRRGLGTEYHDPLQLRQIKPYAGDVRSVRI